MQRSDLAQKEAITPATNSIVEIAASIEDIKKRMDTYQQLLKQLLTEDDTADIQGKKYIKKAGWLKLAVAFNLSTKVIEERKEVDPNDPTKYAYHVTVECLAGNGRTVEELGTCDSTEKADQAEHVIRTMAKTRATSRAIAAMIGASESSAEDMDAVQQPISKDAKRACTCTQKGLKSDCEKNSRNCKRCGGVDLS